MRKQVGLLALMLALGGCGSPQSSELQDVGGPAKILKIQSLDSKPSAQQPVMMQYFHWYLGSEDKLWRKLAQDAPQLAEVGITSLWLPPATKGNWGTNDVGYGVYDLYDLGEFNQKGTIGTKYGTKDEYLQGIAKAKSAGISIYADLVLNHRFGADAVENIEATAMNPQQRQTVTRSPEIIGAATRFTFPGRKGKYSSFTLDARHFTGVGYDENRRQAGVYRFSNKQWSPYVDWELGNSDYLMGSDVDYSNAEVKAEMDNWGQWYLETTGVDGFRFDAVKHIDFRFVSEWLQRLRAKTGKQVLAVGEYFNLDSAGPLEAYLRNLGPNSGMALFDLPLHKNFWLASSTQGQFNMAEIFKNTLLEKQPEAAVTLVENHDTQPCQFFGSTAVLDWFKPLAYALILLQEKGYPSIFYADYFGAEYQDGSCRGTIKSHRPILDQLLRLRQTHARGAQRSYFDHPDLVGYTRLGDGERTKGLAVLVSDAKGGSKWMGFDPSYRGTRYCNVFAKDCVVLNNDGWAEFKVGDGAVAVYVAED